MTKTTHVKGEMSANNWSPDVWVRSGPKEYVVSSGAARHLIAKLGNFDSEGNLKSTAEIEIDYQ